MTIPASDIVQVSPSVVSAGGNALAMNGLILTQDVSVPIGTVKNFSNALDVSNWFGPSSNEYAWAVKYFQGRNNATAYPGSLLFAQYPEVAVAAYLRGGSVAAMTLTQLKALSGTLSLTVNGTLESSTGTIDLAAATSFSNAATIIQAGFTTPNFNVTYDSQRKAFVFTSTTTGVASTITVAAGTLAAGLYLTTATGAVTSQGADAATVAGFMNALIQLTLNWAAFSTVWKASDADMIAFAAWESSQNNRFAYVNWNNAVAAKTYPDTTTALATIISDSYGGVIGVYCDATIDPTGLAAAFILGVIASIDFNRTGGRITLAFKYLDGVPVSILNQTDADNLVLNGYNFIGQWATANDGFTFLYPGQITGQYKFADEYVDQIYLNSQIQLAIMELLVNTNSIPYNAAGNTLIQAACQDPIDQAVNFGSIVPGVDLSAQQAAEVNAAAGFNISDTLSTRGWYLLVGEATAQVRAARGSPPITLWYMDGGAVQKINVASILVQ
jgi:hypothetical protein